MRFGITPEVRMLGSRRPARRCGRARRSLRYLASLRSAAPACGIAVEAAAPVMPTAPVAGLAGRPRAAVAPLPAPRCARRGARLPGIAASPATGSPLRPSAPVAPLPRLAALGRAGLRHRRRSSGPHGAEGDGVDRSALGLSGEDAPALTGGPASARLFRCWGSWACGSITARYSPSTKTNRLKSIPQARSKPILLNE